MKSHSFSRWVETSVQGQSKLLLVFKFVTISKWFWSPLFSHTSCNVRTLLKVQWERLRTSNNRLISNGNRTEWSTTRSVIIRVITKSDDRAAGSLLRRHSLGSSRNLLPQRAYAEAKGTFLTRLRTLSQRSAGDHVKITLEPIGIGLFCNKKLNRLASASMRSK